MFCTKCGKEVGDGEKFCPSCGNPVGGPAKAAKNASSFDLGKILDGFFGMVGKKVKNVGVNGTMYVLFAVTLFLSWLTVNLPIFVIKAGGVVGGISNFTQIAGTVPGAAGFFAGFLAVVMNLALVAAMVMVALPICFNKQTSFTALLTSLCCAGGALVLFLISWLVMNITLSNPYVNIGLGLSLAGWWYLLFAAVSVALAVFLLLEVLKKKNK